MRRPDEEAHPPQRFRDVHAVVVIVAVITLLFADVIFLGANLYHGDVFGFHFGLKKVVRDEILSGNLPEWNRWISAGQPLAANPQYEVFYPPQWLILLPDFLLGFQLHILLHLYIAALGMYALLRSLGVRIGGSLFGAFAFGIGGLTLSHSFVLPLFFALAWMPVVLFGATRALRTGSVRAAVVAALALSMQFLIGEPVTALQTLAVVGAYAIFTRGGSEPYAKTLLRRVAVAGAIVAGAAAIAAVQIVPTIDFVRDSVRSIPLPWHVVRSWSFPVQRLAELLNAHAIGSVIGEGQYVTWGIRLYPDRGAAYFLSIYEGLLVAVFAIAGVFARVPGWRRAVAGFSLALLLALGDHTPLLRMLYDAGAATSVRYFEKFIVAAVFVMIVFASRVFDDVIAIERRVVVAVLAVFAAVTAVSLLLGFLPHDAAQHVFLAFGGTEAGVRSALVDHMRDGWRITAVLAVIAAGLVALPWRSARVRPLAALLLLAFAVIDLAVRVPRLVPRESQRLFTPPAVAADVPPGGRLWPRAEWYKPKDLSRRYGIQEPWYSRGTLSYTTPAAWSIESVLGIDYDETTLLPTYEFVDSFWDAYNGRLPGWPTAYLEMSGVTHRTVFRPGKEWTGDIEDVAPVRIEPTSPGRKAWFASGTVAVRDREAFVRAVAQHPDATIAFLFDGAPIRPGAGEVLAWRARGDVIDVDVATGAEPALLVLAVTPHRYWSATVDGAPARLLRANAGYQALVVPPGGKRVRLVYRNPLVRPAAAVSLVALAACVVLLWRGGRIRSISRGGNRPSA